MLDRVTMVHPSIEGSERVVTQRAFNETWKKKGWRLKEDESSSPPSSSVESSSGESAAPPGAASSITPTRRGS